jgi:hypothetical protein
MKNSDRFKHGETLWDNERQEKVEYDAERDHNIVDQFESRFERYKGQDEEFRPDRKSTKHYL